MTDPPSRGVLPNVACLSVISYNVEVERGPNKNGRKI